MIDLKFNYDFDTEGFFSGVEGEARRETLEQAASFYENFITDNLSAITSGLESTDIGGNNGFNTWTASFFNPATGNIETITDLNVDANTIIIYAGGRDISSLGKGGSGGWSVTGSSDFRNLIKGRGQTGALTNPATDVGIWGGSITFDTDIVIGSTTYDWHNTTDLEGLDSNEFDFLSVAIHELAHVLGFGSSSWANQIGDTNFTGANALAVYQAETDPNATSIPLQSGSLSHWANGTTSLTLTGESQEVALDPSIFNGQRKLLTNLDYAGLQDIGWEFDFSSLDLDLVLSGTENDDTLTGQSGDDSLIGLEGNDQLLGGDGNDTLKGRNGADSLYGQGNNDRLFGGNGNDTLKGGNGADSLYGQGNNDRLFGGNGNDTLRGDAGSDLLSGNNGADLLLGGEGNDTLLGGTGRDTLQGGNGNDRLIGGANTDVLFGNGGSDIFVIEQVASKDRIVIRDYTDGVDVLGLADGLIFDDLTISNNVANTATLIQETSTNNILAVLSGIDSTVIDSGDFIDI